MFERPSEVFHTWLSEGNEDDMQRNSNLPENCCDAAQWEVAWNAVGCQYLLKYKCSRIDSVQSIESVLQSDLPYDAEMYEIKRNHLSKRYVENIQFKVDGRTNEIQEAALIEQALAPYEAIRLLGKLVESLQEVEPLPKNFFPFLAIFANLVDYVNDISQTAPKTFNPIIIAAHNAVAGPFFYPTICQESDRINMFRALLVNKRRILLSTCLPQFPIQR